MKKKKLVSLVVAMAAFLIMSITALAATCPICERYGTVTNIESRGQHLWHHTTYHTVEHTDNGVLIRETCTIVKSEDKIWLICPNGHGVLSKQIYHREIHSSEHCKSLEYYYQAD